MPRDTVVVRGITLTREEVLKAVEDLKGPKFGAGDIVVNVPLNWTADRYMVIGQGTPLGDLLTSEFGPTGRHFVRATDGVICFLFEEHKLKVVGKLSTVGI